jgi:ATP-binding cassette subfamily F protein 3
MSLLVLEHVSLAFGGQKILSDASLRIGEKERIGLVGPNGSGKSTLFRILMGMQPVDSGQVRRSRSCRIGYLPQDVLELEGDTLLGSVLASVPGRLELDEKLNRCERELEATDDPERQLQLAVRLGELAEELSQFEMYYSERQAARILAGLGFSSGDLSRPTHEFSGGWKMRGALAGLLFQQPDVLFLDEPTNHLDLPSVLWLDGFLNELAGSMVLICHDRSFLNRHVQRVVSFEPDGLRSYRGNYDSYVEQRDVEDEIRSANLRNRERELKKTERFVERFKAKATKARQAQSRARRVRRLQAELEADRPAASRKALSFRFPEVSRTGRDVVRVIGLSKSFGSIQLYDDLTRTVYAGDRIGIVGVNGAGKTTLLKILAGELESDQGEVRYGANVSLGYYAQHHNELLVEGRTVLDEVRRVQPGVGESFIRGVCGAFLFSRDEVDKVVGVLSGGERARVLLARLLVKPGNFLLMDEPTNHLDVAAADALAEALDGYGGTLVFVSHNTAFVDRLATRIWDIEGGKVIDYPGSLTGYLERKRRLAASESGSSTSARTKTAKSRKKKAPSVGRPKSSSRSKRAPEAPAPSARTVAAKQAPEGEHPGEGSSRRTRRRRRDRGSSSGSAVLEARVAALREESKRLEQELSEPDLYANQPLFSRTFREHRDAVAKLEELEHRLAKRRKE